MKLTKEQLRRIIKEELGNVLELKIDPNRPIKALKQQLKKQLKDKGWSDEKIADKIDGMSDEDIDRETAANRLEKHSGKGR